MKEPFSQAFEISQRSDPHVEDVRRLLAFHGLSYGAPDSLEAVKARLADSNALRTDLSALARHISDLEHRVVTDDEMQALVELAVGGQQWTEKHNSLPKPASGVTSDPSAIPTAAETGGSQGGLELVIAELKVYLDDIDRRIGRLEPRLEDLTRLLQNSADRSQQPPDAGKPSNPEPRLPDQQQLTARIAPPHPPEETDLRHRGAPLRAPTPWPRGDLSAAPASSPVPTSPPPAEPAGVAAAAQLRPWEHITAPLDHKRSDSSTRQTVGKFLGVAAVLLAIVGGIAALYAFGNPGESASTAQTGTPSTQDTSPTSDRARPTPESSQMAAQQTGPMPAPSLAPPESRLGAISQPESPTALPRAPVPVPVVRPKRENKTAAPAKVAGKRSEPLRREPQIEVLPAVHPPPRGTIAVGRPATQPVASRTGSEGASSVAANSPPPGVSTLAAGTPEVEANSSEGALISTRKPVYPPEALSQHKEGTVVLNAVIGKDGTVKRMDVVEGSPGFTRSALNAVSWWRYKPNHARGEAAETQARITVNYRIR